MQKFTKDEIIYNIISKLTKDIEFLGLENYSKDISTKKLKIILRCKLHNISKIIKYSSFILNGWHCPECSKIKRTLPENIAIERIQKSILKKNNEGSNISFLGFVNFWKGSSTKLILKCNIHNIIWKTTTYNGFISNNLIGCPECSKERKKRKLTNLEAENNIIEFHKSSSTNESSIFCNIHNSYTGYNSPVELVCYKHGKFSCYYSYLMTDKSRNIILCPKCRELFEREQEKKRYHNLIIDRVNHLNKKYNISLEFLGFKEEFNYQNTYLILKCNIHNHIWDTTRLGIFLKHEGKYCIYCSKTSSISFMENSLYSILNSYYLNIIRQYKLIINNRIFYLDFYIPKLNVIIEYDGKQHYEFTSFFQSTYQDFVNQINRDRCLEQYCKENNIKLLRISYKDNNRIPEIIKIFFEEGKDITTKVEPKLLPVLYHG